MRKFGSLDEVILRGGSVGAWVGLGWVEGV